MRILYPHNFFSRRSGNILLRILVVLSISLITLLIIPGCGGGGGGGGSSNSTGGGLGNSALASRSTVRINFQDALNLSVSRVASDLDLSIMMVNQHEPVLARVSKWEDIIGVGRENDEEHLKHLDAKVSASRVRKANLNAIRNKITQFKIIVTAPDLVLPVIAIFPSTATEGSVQVESGSKRKIRVEGIGVDLDGIEKTLIAAEATVDLTPAITTKVGGQNSDVPVTFEEVDSTAPITALFFSGEGAVEGPHRQAVDLTLSNFEGAAIQYKITEVGNPNSQLPAVTSSFVSATSTVVIRLDREATYLFQYKSTDSSGNEEILNEKQVVVNFNLNPPESVVNYRGRPYKILSGSFVGVSVKVLESQTATVAYRVDNGTSKDTSTLRNGQVELVKLGTEGILPVDPILNLSTRATVNGGSSEVSEKTTEIELLELLVNGQNVVQVTGSSQHILTSGPVEFCDQDSSSIFQGFSKSNGQPCPNNGVPRSLYTGPMDPGVGDDFPCVQVQSGQLVVVDDGPNGACQSCSTYKDKSGVNCP